MSGSNKQLQHRLLRRRKNFLLGTILGIFLVFGVGTFAALRIVQDTFQSTIRNEFEIKSRLHGLHVEMLEMNRNERDYLMSIDDFMKDMHSENILKIKDFAAFIGTHGADPHMLELFQEFEQQIGIYVSNFEHTSLLVQEEKAPKKGLRHKLRSLGDQIQNQLSQPGAPKAAELFSQIRQYEQTYFASQKAGDLEKFHTLLQNLTTKLNQTPSQDPGRTLLDQYAAHVERLRAIHEDRAARRKAINQSFTAAEERVIRAGALIDAAVQTRQTIVEKIVQGMNTLVLSMIVLAFIIVGFAARMISGMMNSLSTTSEALEKQTTALQSVMDHVPEGIFVLQPGLLIGTHYSLYLEEIFGQHELAGKPALDVMMPGSNWTLEQWSIVQTVSMSAMEEDLFAWDVNSWQMPSEMALSLPGRDDKVLEFSWNPVTGKDQTIEHILVTVRDVTQIRVLQKENQQRQSRINLLMELISTKPQAFDHFYQEARELIEQCRALSSNLSREIFIRLHTLKGLARGLKLNQLTSIVHEVEQPFAALHKGDVDAIDVERLERDFDRIHSTLEQYSEMQKQRVSSLVGEGTAKALVPEPLDKLEHALVSLNGQEWPPSVQSLCAASDEVLAWFSDDLGETLQKTFDQNASIAQELGKAPVHLHLHLPPALLMARVRAAVGHAWLHILRNAIDHGIEPADERMGQRKTAAGTVNVQGTIHGNDLQVIISDDGRGLSLEGIRRKGEALHLLTSRDEWPAERIADLIFASGFSTRETTSTISGRGVGMDAVRRLLASVGASVRLELLPVPAKAPVGYRPFQLVITVPGGLWHRPPAGRLKKSA